MWIRSMMAGAGILCIVTAVGANSVTAEPEDAELVAARAKVRPVAADETQRAERKARKRAALAGPASQPAADTDGRRKRTGDGERRGRALFKVMDRNHDEKLQAEEIGRFIKVFKAAEDEATGSGDLTPEQFDKYAEQLRGGRGKALKGKLKKVS